MARGIGEKCPLDLEKVLLLATKFLQGNFRKILPEIQVLIGMALLGNRR
jgi:hypothetical protein